jgi:ABC-2 type transport system ATP-binding protein
VERIQESAVELRGVMRSFPLALGFRQRPVLLGVDLALAAGRTLGLAGPNGSGKSTLLRILAGVDRADAGSLRVFGASPASTSVRRRIGFLPEESPFPPELSARAALDLLGSLQGMPRAERRREGARLLDVVGLGADARHRLGRFSRGMLRRFGLAQAMLARPDLLLLDEPTAGLDAAGFEVLAEILGEMRARGGTVILATHLLGDLREACDEIAVILGGRIAIRGDPRDLLRERTLLDLYRGDLDRQDGRAAP